MPRISRTLPVRGPWSLPTSRRFWEGFTPATLPAGHSAQDCLSTTFRVEADWSVASVVVTQDHSTAAIIVDGDGDLDAAAAQTGRFLALDVDARDWPEVGDRDPVIAAVQQQLPGLRPCGFHSPYEAAAWSVLSQRVRMSQAARLRADLIDRHGDGGAFPAPATLARISDDLPGRKTEYLQAVAAAALDGLLDTHHLRACSPEQAMPAVQTIKGIGPFAAELIVLRGANAPDGLPVHERRLEAVVADRYGPAAALDEISRQWRPFRTWAAFHLRAWQEMRPS